MWMRWNRKRLIKAKLAVGELTLTTQIARYDEVTHLMGHQSPEEMALQVLECLEGPKVATI